jgi:NAD(P)-dependent dehydrogenase (short-subunit alcohol dehydrogenase family)
LITGANSGIGFEAGRPLRPLGRRATGEFLSPDGDTIARAAR